MQGYPIIENILAYLLQETSVIKTANFYTFTEKIDDV